MKQETEDLINWIKNACVNYAEINGSFDINNKACDFLDILKTVVTDDFKTNIPDSLKQAILKNDMELYVSFYYNFTTKEIEKYFHVRRSFDDTVREFYYEQNHLKELEIDINSFIYSRPKIEGEKNDL